MKINQYESKIISLLSDGYSQKEIARDLKTSTKVINNRLRYARHKNGAKSTIHLVLMAQNLLQ